MSSLDVKNILPLLDDEDEEVYKLIKDKILGSGAENIPLLERALDSVSTLLQHNRIESMIFHLKMVQMKDQLAAWIHSENKSLQEGWILISSVQGIEVSPQIIEKVVKQITTKIWLEMNLHQTSLEKIAIVNKIFFDLYDFRVNYSKRLALEDFFIDKILISRRANKLTLNMLYAIIARKLDLPLMPVTVGNKIILAYFDPVLSREAFMEITHPFLYFIDVEEKGRIIGVKEFDYIMKENQLSWNSELTLSNKDVIKKLLIEMKNLCFMLNDKEKVLFSEDLLRNFDNC